MMRQVSCPVRRGAGRKGRKDLARSLPSFNVREVLFLSQVSQAFLPSQKACWTHGFRHWGVGQQYPVVFRDKLASLHRRVAKALWCYWRRTSTLLQDSLLIHHGRSTCASAASVCGSQKVMSISR